MLKQILSILSVIIVIIILASLFGSGLPFAEQSASAAEEGKGLDLSKIELPDKGDPKLDSQLNKLVSAATARRSFSRAQESSIGTANDTVRVIVECLSDQIGTANRTAGELGVVETSYGNLLQVMVPVSQLKVLADTPGIRLVRMPQQPLPAAITSEGVALVNADDWQSAGYNGTGVKVGILDGGFADYTTRQSQGELPSVVSTNWSVSLGGPGSSDHGTACAEIVYDIAPAAQFYLANFGTDVEFGSAVNWLIAQGVNVISCSIGWPIGGPGDGTGIFCQIVDNARANGILWSQAIGNSAQMHWQGNFTDTDTDGWHEFNQSPLLDEANDIIVESRDTIIVALKWDDAWGSSSNDYDLYLIYVINGTPTIVWGSENEQNGNDDPWEGFIYTADYTGRYYIAIYNYSATRAVNFHLYSYYHDLQYRTASSSFAVPADSASATAVGAVFWNSPTTLESFSSRGPTKDGRVKPDLVAPDGVSTASYGASDFYGTSASAPHVAGAAVLVKQHYSSYTPAQIQSFLESRAVDLGASGKDNLYGSGRLDLGSLAVTTIAASNITADSATLNGNLGSLGPYSSANVSFKWGTVSGNLTLETMPQAMASTGNFSANLTSLAPSTTCYFQAKAAANATAYGSELSFTTLTVLVSANVTPDNSTIALGRTQQFIATGNYSDNSTANITDSVTWTSSNTTVANIIAAGLARSLDEGQTVIAASSGNVSANTTLTVGPKVLDLINISPGAPTIALGRTRQFTATGNYSDNSTLSITDNVTWFSSNTTVATINATGLARSLAQGQTAISANLSGVSGNTTLTVSAKVLDTIAVTPANPSIDAGRTQQFIATGNYSDNSTANLTGSVAWRSSNVTAARINAAGLARSYAEGTTVITAFRITPSGNISDNATLMVGPAVLDNIYVIPPAPTITFISGPNPPVLQFIAKAVYSDGATANFTSTANWTSDNESVATINATGLATTVAPGTTTISANFSSTTGNTTLTVLPDTVAPVVTLISPTEGQTHSSNTTIVAGTVDDLAATANVTVNGGVPIALTLGGSGNFSQSVSLNLGINTILVIAVDDAGNLGTSGTVTVVFNPNRPGITITQPPPKTVTDNSSLTVTGTASGNVSSANLILNGVSRSVAVVGSNFSANVTLTEGVNIIAVTAYINGHEGDNNYRGASGMRTVALDTTPPIITIIAPVAGSVVGTPKSMVFGFVDDPGISTVDLTLNGASQSITVIGGSFRQYITLASGNNTVTITATNVLGKTSSASVTVLYDNTKPEVTITSPPNRLVTNNASQTVTGSVDDPTVTTATLYFNSVTRTISVAADGSFSENITLTAGVNTIEVTASDNATPVNTGTTGVRIAILDNTAPVIRIGLSDPTFSITIIVASNEALATAPTVSVNSTANVTMTPIGMKKWSGNYGSILSLIVPGAYVVTVNGTDRAGNSTIRTATFAKRALTVAANATATVQTSTTTLEISTTANVTDASISVTQHLDNPSGNVGNPSGAEKAVGAFIEIVASPELQDNLKQIYIRVDYDHNELPPDTDESTLRLYLWDVDSGTWQIVPGSGVNTTEHYIYGTVTHLSKYGGFGTAPVPPPPSNPPSGGGGGGGGGGSGSTAEEGVSITRVSKFVTSTGVFNEAVTAKSADGKTEITIDRRTVGKTKEGGALSSISITEKEEPPAASKNWVTVGLTYDIAPDGATFDPPVKLTITYEPDKIPKGVSEKDLVIAVWGKDAGDWVVLEGIAADAVSHTVTALASHFTPFAVVAPVPPAPPAPPPPQPASVPARAPAPANFAVSDLSVTPSEVKPAEQVIISAVVTNTGGSEGIYMVVLKINDVEGGRKEVTLGAGKSEIVTFTVEKDVEGRYTVNIGGNVGQFTVIAPPSREPEPAPTEVLPQPPTNWWLIGSIIAGCIVAAGLLVYFFVWRRRSTA